jgi:hypothetical protein
VKDAFESAPPLQGVVGTKLSRVRKKDKTRQVEEGVKT